jgi:hypothetical protein
MPVTLSPESTRQRRKGGHARDCCGCGVVAASSGPADGAGEGLRGQGKAIADAHDAHSEAARRCTESAAHRSVIHAHRNGSDEPPHHEASEC